MSNPNMTNQKNELEVSESNKVTKQVCEGECENKNDCEGGSIAKRKRAYSHHSIKTKVTGIFEMTNRVPLKVILINVTFGQILSIVGILNGFIATYVNQEYKVNLPLLMSVAYYTLLFLIFFIRNRKLTYPKLNYLLIGLFDSQGTFLNVLAFSTINFSYPYIINISSVVWTILLTYLFIKIYRYLKSHILGMIICIIGIGVIVLELVITDYKELSFNKNLMGIVYCLIASLCYTLSSIIQELTFKTDDDVFEFFPWEGITGALLTGIEAIFFNEYDILFSNEYCSDLVLFCLAFGAALVVFAIMAPFYIKRCSASMFNISLVTQIVWSYIIGIIAFNQYESRIFYFIGLALIIVGVVVFNLYDREVVEVEFEREFGCEIKEENKRKRSNSKEESLLLGRNDS